MKTFLLKLLSKITGRPVALGYGVTCDQMTVKNEPAKHKPENLIFFTLRKDLGIFEITEVRHGKHGEVKYKVSHPDSEQELIIPQKWFNFLFEEIQVTHEPYFTRK